jgi:Na+-translocating ferredoxin:NAD+ oxidoreductase subunit B
MAHFITQACTGCTGCVRYCPVKAIDGKRKLQHIINSTLCIDCGVCGRVCVARAVVDANGNPIEKMKPHLWFKPAWNYTNCTGCRICIQTCPVGCLFLDKAGSDGHKALPYLKKEQACIGCSFCARSCPLEVITMAPPQSLSMREC